MSITAFAAQLRQELPSLNLQCDVPLSGCTTLRLGGPAALLAEPANTAELRALLRILSHTNDAPQMVIIGHGSNLLVRDEGFPGLVIRIGQNMSGISIEGTTMTCQAGTMMGQAAMAAANAGLSGLSFASGIPGTVGGGAVMNAGAYGGEMAQVISSVDAVTYTGEEKHFDASELGFGYRTSRLQAEELIVTAVTFALQPGTTEAILAEMSDLNHRRAEKQPLEYPSAGSTFKRPVGGFAAAMIDECGLKGYQIGGAQVSEKHAGFLVNRGGTAADFMNLMQHVQHTVYEKTGILLEPEVKII